MAVRGGSLARVLISVFLVALLAMPSIVRAEPDLGLRRVLSVAKFAGACGIMDEMINFQKKTKLNGGKNFVYRFWVAESARLGFTVEEMSDRCTKTIKSYDKFWSMGEPK